MMKTLSELIESAKSFGIPVETFARITWLKLIEVVETGTVVSELTYKYDSNRGKFAYCIYSAGDEVDAKLYKI
jgi:hypothetical protein